MTVVRTTAGHVRGTVQEGVHAFLGIPYAAPPSGSLRYRAPVPPLPPRAWPCCSPDTPC